MWLLLKNVIFTVLAPGTVVGLLPWRILVWTGGDAIPAVGWLQVLAVVPAVTAVGIYVWCVYDFMVVGRGTPAPVDPPQELVVRGLYRVTRNPLYVAVFCMIAAEAMFFASAWLLLYAAAMGIVFQSFVVLYEEPTLRRLFGAAYADYTTSVPRWFW